MKNLIDDPWKHVQEKYTLGQKVKGKVLKINPFGLFVELDDDIHGLAHVSELSNKPDANPFDAAKPGDTLEFRIVSIKPDEHRLGLSLKALNDPDSAFVAPAVPEVSEEKAEPKTEAPVEVAAPEVTETPEGE